MSLNSRLIAVLLTFAAGCGDDADTEPLSETCLSDSSLCVSFFVDPQPGHTFRKFSVIGFEEETPTRPPDVRLLEIDNPEIVDGEIRIEHILEPYRGEYYIWGVLYNADDPSPLATAELDYTGQTAIPITLDGSSIHLDSIELELEPPEAP